MLLAEGAEGDGEEILEDYDDDEMDEEEEEVIISFIPIFQHLSMSAFSGRRFDVLRSASSSVKTLSR